MYFWAFTSPDMLEKAEKRQPGDIAAARAGRESQSWWRLIIAMAMTVVEIPGHAELEGWGVIIRFAADNLTPVHRESDLDAAANIRISKSDSVITEWRSDRFSFAI